MMVLMMHRKEGAPGGCVLVALEIKAIGVVDLERYGEFKISRIQDTTDKTCLASHIPFT